MLSSTLHTQVLLRLAHFTWNEHQPTENPHSDITDKLLLSLNTKEIASMHSFLLL